MVKIEISVEGENLSEIVSELVKILGEVVKSNKAVVREIVKVFGEEAVSVLMERKMLEKGAKLYRELIEEINWQYKEKKS
ncbi:MAG TPA: hypothetical protein ENI45_05075 [Thermoplasmatales archaeon]|nr:hypothetical protein [Thermoplasmatales archaeon]